MRIAQLVSNYHPVGEHIQKAISSHTAALTNGLVRRGHDVHLFASSDSDTDAVLHSVSASLSSQELPPDIQRYLMSLNVSRCYAYAKDAIDVIHTHFNVLTSTLFAPLVDVPTLISVHTPLEQKIRPYISGFQNARFISISYAQRQTMPELNWYANIYHGVDMNTFTFNPEPENYALYLGRITEDKGVHHAITAAKAAGYPLYIAGSSYSNEGYWQTHIEPHINGASVRYVGEANMEEKIKLLRGARALLFPTQVSEVFGYVMIEAMACGTPVIGFGNGSVPEIVKDGVSGFVVNDAEEMAEALRRVGSLDREKVRQRAQLYFSLEKMISGYEKVYKRTIADTAFSRNKRTNASDTPSTEN